ncbi:MAG: glycosyltransferase family A protein [Acidobacteriaceae bacterium]
METSSKSPKVSVVLTTYKRGHILAETIEAILGQTFADFELLICDDCSPDETERVCRRYENTDARVHYRRRQKNMGMPKNLNEGILASTGDYVANLHDGDMFDPMLLEKWSAALDKYPNAAFVFNAYREVDREGKTVHLWREPLGPCIQGRVLLEEIYFRRWMFDSPVWGTVMCRRSAYLKAGLFDPRFGYVSDVDMWLRLAEENEVAYVAEPLIGLPTTEALPKSWKGVPGSEQIRTQVERMFLEARIRHNRGRPGRLILELMRHGAFVAMARSYRVACRVKARLRRETRGKDPSQ